MKSIFSISAFALLAGLQIPQCSPIYYCFTGTVTGSDTSAHPVGSTVTYQFMVNPDTAGYVTENGNTQHIPSVGPLEVFYARYVSGDALSNDSPYRATWSENLVENYFGYDPPLTIFEGSNSDPSGLDGIHVLGYYAFPDWAVDPSMIFKGENTVATLDKDADGRERYIRVHSDLSLVYIGSVPMDSDPVGAVPEPTTLALAGMGLLGLLATARRKRD